MSKNFELMRGAGKGMGRTAVVSPVSFEGREIAPPRSVTVSEAENKASDWVRAASILQKNWKLSAGFAALVMITVAVVTFFTKPVYEATTRIEVDPPGEMFSLGGRRLGPERR